MEYRRRFTILGCSSSPGVPRITGDWGACDPSNPKNRRTRASLLVEQMAPDGAQTTVVIDTGPDFREQMIAAGVQRIDATLYTHAHADHLHGIDDLRGYFHAQHQAIPIYAEPETMRRIRAGFGYCLATPADSSYPPIVTANLIEDLDAPFAIDGPGGSIEFQPLKQEHGDIVSLGFRIGDFAYCSDVSAIPDKTAEKLDSLDVLVIDALQYKPHPSHLSVDQALEWIGRLKPGRAILTHMHTPLDYDTLMAETPKHVEPAYDGLVVEMRVSRD